MHLKRQSLNHYGGVGVVVLLLISLILLAACDTGYPDKVGDTKLTIEEMREVAVSISYDELKRNPSKYEGTVVKYNSQIIERVPDTNTAFRANITNHEFYWADDIYLRVDNPGFNIIENDIIFLVGISRGQITYTTIFGAQRTIPLIDAYYVELKN